MEDLESLIEKSYHELMSSHVHKLIQVCVLIPLSYAFFFFFY